MGDAQGTLMRIGQAKCHNCLTIVITHDLITVFVRSRRAVAGISSTNPALDGAAAYAKLASQCDLGVAFLVQLLHTCSLGLGQSCLGMIAHRFGPSVIHYTRLVL